MDLRTQLKAMLDEFDDEDLIAAEVYLMGIVERRTPPIRSEVELARLDRRAEEFRKTAEKHWREAFDRRAGGKIGSFGGGGGFGLDHSGRATGKFSFSFPDGDANVEESLRFVAGRELEIIDRFRLRGDTLVYEQIVRPGTRTLERAEEFPPA